MPSNIGVGGDVRGPVLSSKCATPMSESTEQAFCQIIGRHVSVGLTTMASDWGPERAPWCRWDITEVAERKNRSLPLCWPLLVTNWQREKDSELNTKCVAATVFVTSDRLGQSKCGPNNITRQSLISGYLYNEV
jgi:hypothetical protein